MIESSAKTAGAVRDAVVVTRTNVSDNAFAPPITVRGSKNW